MTTLCYSKLRGWQTFSLKGQILNILSFEGWSITLRILWRYFDPAMPCLLGMDHRDDGRALPPCWRHSVDEEWSAWGLKVQARGGGEGWPQASFSLCSRSQPASVPRASCLIWISWPEARQYVESPTYRMRFIHSMPDSHQQRTLQHVGGGQCDQNWVWTAVRHWRLIREVKWSLVDREGPPSWVSTAQ